MALKTIARTLVAVIIAAGILIIQGDSPPAVAYCERLNVLEAALQPVGWPGIGSFELADRRTDAIQNFLGSTTDEMILDLPEEYQDSARNIVNIGRPILELSDGTPPILRTFGFLDNGILLEIKALDDFCL